MVAAFFILFYGFIIACLVVYYRPRIKERQARKGMMDNVRNEHGRIAVSMLEGKSFNYSAPAGYSVTSSGNYIAHYSIEEGCDITGFAVEFVPDNQVGIWLHSLNRRQANPCHTYPYDKLTGTVSYATDKNGKHYFVSFTPDAH